MAEEWCFFPAILEMCDSLSLSLFLSLLHPLLFSTHIPLSLQDYRCGIDARKEGGVQRIGRGIHWEGGGEQEEQTRRKELQVSGECATCKQEEEGENYSESQKLLYSERFWVRIP